MNKARTSIILVLVASIAVAGIARQWAMSLQQKAHASNFSSPGDKSVARRATPSLAGMDSYALALLLGGLRGPLVMFLWTSSENQKSSHELADFDTKVEWIRLLQPEFDVVHLFQIWNKAYNISAQISSLPGKYVTILDAIDYARNVDRDHPDDINIISNIGSLYADKLGGSSEKEYYIRRVRAETKAATSRMQVRVPEQMLGEFLLAAEQAGLDEPEQDPSLDLGTHTFRLVIPTEIAQRVQPAFEPRGVKFELLPKPVFSAAAGSKSTRLPPMVDVAGNILPEFTAPAHDPRPAGVSPDADWYDGSELEFLPAVGPFPYGISPEALGYSYFKRAQMLHRVAHEEHLQESDFIMDSRPALALKDWAIEEGALGRQAEARLFGIDDTGMTNSGEYRAPGADQAQIQLQLTGRGNLASQLEKRPNAQAGIRALYQYQRAADLFRTTEFELNAHILLYPSSRAVYLSHLDDEIGYENLYQADHDFLQGVLDPSQRGDKWSSATKHYILARQQFEYNILKYYSEDAVNALVFPMDTQTHRQLIHSNIDRITPAERDQLYPVFLKATEQYIANPNNFDSHHDERTEENAHVQRAQSRIAAIALLGNTPLNQPPFGSAPTINPVQPPTTTFSTGAVQ